MFCFNCHQLQDTSLKVSFRSVCPNCKRDLHVCKNCKYFSVGKPNDCLIPGTEPVLDREKFNFCEDFFPSDLLLQKTQTSENVAKKLFRDDSYSSKKEFKDLFKDL